MLTERDLLAALAAIGVSAPVRAEEVTGSTNATALELAAQGAPEWALVAAGHQTAGRGRLDRSWTDVAGRALLCSVVLRPEVPPAETGLLSVLAGASMADAIEAVAGVEARCTWPNDLFIGEAKVGGILAEAVVEDDVVRHVVLGVGVNLEAPSGVAGAGAVGAGTDAGALLTAFLERFADGYRAGSLGERARAAWLAINATIGRPVRASVAGGTITGLAVGLDPLGALVIETDDGTVTVGAGDVTLLRQD